MKSKVWTTIALTTGLTLIGATPSLAVVTSVEFDPSTSCPGTDTTLYVNGQTTNITNIGAGYWLKQTIDGVTTYYDGTNNDLWPGLYAYADFSTWPATYEWIIEIYQGDPRVPGGTLIATDALTITDTCPPAPEETEEPEEPQPEESDNSDNTESLAATGSNPAVIAWVPVLALATAALGTLRFWRRKRSN